MEPQRNICGRRAEIFLTPSRNLQLIATNISVWQLFNPHWKLSNEHFCETVTDILSLKDNCDGDNDDDDDDGDDDDDDDDDSDDDGNDV